MICVEPLQSLADQFPGSFKCIDGSLDNNRVTAETLEVLSDVGGSCPGGFRDVVNDH